MMDRMGQEIAFKGLDTSAAYVPAISLGAGQYLKVNFGQVSQTYRIIRLCQTKP